MGVRSTGSDGLGLIQSTKATKYPGLNAIRRKHCLSAEPPPVSAYVGSSKNLKDLRDLNKRTKVICSLFFRRACRWAMLRDIVTSRTSKAHRPAGVLGGRFLRKGEVFACFKTSGTFRKDLDSRVRLPIRKQAGLSFGSFPRKREMLANAGKNRIPKDLKDLQ